ncbi:hypothetical protein DPMN_168314 [Dreissena polymorpha]|uniref:Uncharacterized protein n=1 Tax=Dreissena polymorpha TaxID=45954 RepID=A0A9D4F0E7_DREPO|nr:hypothetical protein DPMN_168314 [Dreissena polymorpha]
MSPTDDKVIMAPITRARFGSGIPTRSRTRTSPARTGRRPCTVNITWRIMVGVTAQTPPGTLQIP